MFVISYVIIFAFHLHSEHDRVIIERSFRHDFQRLVNVRYLNRDILIFPDHVTVTQFQDCVTKVSKKNNKESIAEMFSAKMRFVANSLMQLFQKSLNKKNFEVSLNKK